jgi:hypothetical protein
MVTDKIPLDSLSTFLSVQIPPGVIAVANPPTHRPIKFLPPFHPTKSFTVLLPISPHKHGFRPRVCDRKKQAPMDGRET